MGGGDGSLRWTLLTTVVGFGCLLLVGYVGVALGWGRALPLVVGDSRESLLIAAGIYATWVLTRPLIVASTNRRDAKASATQEGGGASVVIPAVTRPTRSAEP